MDISRQQIAETAQFTLQLGKMLLQDIPAERFAEMPVESANHPAWIIGHLAFAAEGGATLLGGDRTMPEDQQAKFKPGSELSGDAAAYPSKDELIAAWEDGTARALALLPKATDEFLASDLEDENRRARFGTHGRLLTFLLTSHAAFHLGQLSTWRRAAGLGSAM